MLTAARNAINSYNEKGAGTLNLHVKTDSSNFLEGRIGAEASRLFLTKNLTKIRPQFSLSYGYDLIGAQQKSTINFIGQTINFTNDGSKIAQGSLKIATGFALYSEKETTISLNYGLEHRSNYTSTSSWIRLRHRF